MADISRRFGDSLRAIRKERGWSQEEMAKKLGTTKQVLSKYENSQRSPNVYVAYHYAKTLEVSLAHMLGEEETDESSSSPSLPVSEKRKACLSLVEVAPEAKINLISGLIQSVLEDAGK